MRICVATYLRRYLEGSVVRLRSDESGTHIAAKRVLIDQEAASSVTMPVLHEGKMKFAST
jgi:hypothetical protein